MKGINFKGKKIVLLVIIFWMAALGIFLINKNINAEISDSDKDEIVKLVMDYYDLIEEKNYELALFNIDNSSDLIDKNTMVRALYDINDSILEEFKVTGIHDNVHYSKEYKSIAMSVTIEIKYRGTRGGATNEYVLVHKTDSGWKIHTIRGIDRYGFYRAPTYEYLGLFGFLDER